MSLRMFRKWLTDSCEIYRMKDSTVPGNTPKLSYERIPGVFRCRYVKRSANISETVLGGVPVDRHTLFLLPDTEIKENYRVRVNGKDFTVQEVLPIKRLRRVHHLEVELKARS